MKQPTKKERIYEILRRAIISGELKPGDILNENELAQRYQAGKTPTREALIVLAHERFIESMPRVGYIVTNMSLNDILETFHLRTILEEEAIALAAEKISDEELRELEQNNDEESQVLQTLTDARQRERAYELNRQFHLQIARASGNTRLVGLIQQLIDDLVRCLVMDPRLADHHQHKDILDALRARDKEAARQAMRRHLEETRAGLLHRF